MPKISLTSFIDFVHKSGTPKMTCVRKVKGQYDAGYQIEHDYWRLLREKIIEVFKGGKPLENLSDVLNYVQKSDKFDNYSARIRGIRKYVEKKNIRWCGIDKGAWKHNDLTVIVNPELGLTINGEKYAVKLYFKAEELSKRRAECIFYLMKKTFKREHRGYIPAILDCRNAKLVRMTKEVENIEILLFGEAAAFVSMWEML